MQLTQENTNWSQPSKDYLLNNLSHSNTVLVYGCDMAPTICNHDSVSKVYAVDARKAVCDTVYDAINQKETLHLMYANVGELDNNSQPVNTDQYKHYHQYMVFPWALADKYNVLPDLIVIDGHFKVASFLYSLICAKEGSTIIVNNYFGNPELEVLRSYCSLESRQGDAAVFVVKKNYVLSDITAMIAKYCVLI